MAGIVLLFRADGLAAQVGSRFPALLPATGESRALAFAAALRAAFERPLQGLGLGCDIAQGYYVARPFPAGEMQAWLAAAPYTPPAAH
jgi:hypothetical protein